MTKRPLLTLLLIGAVVLTGINVLIGAWSHKLPYYLKLEALRKAPEPNLLFVGNSLLDHHIDEAALTQAAAQGGAQFVVLNSALGASEPPEQRLLFHYSVQKHPGIRTVVVGIYDFQLTAEDHSKLTDLTGNRMVGIDHRFAAAEVAKTYGFRTIERAELAILRALPMAANRANIWKFVELLRRNMSSMGMPHTATNSMGRVDDFAALEARSPKVFDAQAEAFLSQPDHFNQSYQAVFDEARAKGLKVVVVVMPMSPSHHESFYTRPLWGQYLQALNGLAAFDGIKVIDASGWMPDASEFVDHLHMTQPAAHQFSVRLGGELAKAVAH